jgi:hypothetical protein
VNHLDFNKAFNKVPPKRLLAELRAKEISEEICSWVENLSLKRKQRIRMGGVLSEEEVGSGVS